MSNECQKRMKDNCWI